MIDWVQVSRGGVELDREKILSVLPHREPFLFVDRVLEVKTAAPLSLDMSAETLHAAKAGSYAKTKKDVRAEEDFFRGHFPGYPIFPGVLSVEVMAQSAIFVTAPFIAVKSQGKLPSLQVALAGLDGVRFRRPVRPGDTLITTVVLKNAKASLWSFDAKAEVAGKPVAEASFLAHLSESARS